MTATPRVTIGLPVYNAEKYLVDAMDALLGQTFEDFELIISDNSSTDSTAQICQHYLQADSRIRYFRQPRNIGQIPNHNFVFHQARGELFKFAACDDLYGRDLLRCCVEALDANPEVVLAHSWTAVIDEDSNVTQSLEYPLATDSPRAAARFRSFLWGGSGLFESRDPARQGMIRVANKGLLWACDEYGLIRVEVMRRVAPLRSFHHSDRILLCELMLNGPFHQTPAWMYFRRAWPDQVYNKHPSVHDRCALMDPARSSRLRHPAPRLLAEYMLGYVGAIRRAPLSAAERRECYRELVRWASDRATNKILPGYMASREEQPPAELADRGVSLALAVAGQEKREEHP
jgi:glycosyltransferase involved in cell wall biosynthesis